VTISSLKGFRRRLRCWESAVPAPCLVDGGLVSSCPHHARANARGPEISSRIEGLSHEWRISIRLQQAFSQTQAFQCGYCTPGMIICERIACQATLIRRITGARLPVGNLCRCGTYTEVLARSKNWRKNKKLVYGVTEKYRNSIALRKERRNYHDKFSADLRRHPRGFVFVAL